MPSKTGPAAEFAAKMLAALESLRAAADGSYPPAAKRLAELADPCADASLIAKAIAHRSFSSRALLARPRDPDALVVFVEDADVLADSPVLLEQVLESVCTPEQRAWPIRKLKARLATSLRARFEQALRKRIETGQLPPSIGSIPIRRTVHLFLRRLPYGAPERALAERMVGVLDAQRAPLSLRQLTEQADPRASAALVKKALAEELFRARVLTAFAKPTPDSLVALVDDLDALAKSSRLLETLVAAGRTATTVISGPTTWKKKLEPRLWPVFQESLTQRTQSGTLPATVCWLQFRGKANYFLRADLNGGTVTDGATTAADDRAIHAQTMRSGEKGEESADFPRRFADAFDRLNRASGGHNFVSLFDLRQAIAIDRLAFDAGLRDLRFDGRYTLSAAEGRHGLRSEERDAGIMEDGTLLLYVARRNTP